MEHLFFEFQGSGDLNVDRPACLVGVVSSGNLEVLVEPADLNGRSQININTSAQGFGVIWRAVLNDFAARHDLGNLRISVNDAGATPAVASLRLDQAMEEFLRRPHE